MYTLTTTNLKTLDSHTIRFDSLNQLPVFIYERIRATRHMPVAFHRGGIYYNVKGPHC